MKTNPVTILGRKHAIAGTLTPEQVRSLERTIRTDLDALQARYPSVDRIDLLVFYVIDLWERIQRLQTSLSRGRESAETARARLRVLAADVEQELRKLTHR